MPTSQSQAQKVYAEVITDNGIAATRQVQKVYLEVIGDPASASPPSTALPAICVCT